MTVNFMLIWSYGECLRHSGWSCVCVRARGRGRGHVAVLVCLLSPYHASHSTDSRKGVPGWYFAVSVFFVGLPVVNELWRNWRCDGVRRAGNECPSNCDCETSEQRRDDREGMLGNEEEEKKEQKHREVEEENEEQAREG